MLDDRPGVDQHAARQDGVGPDVGQGEDLAAVPDRGGGRDDGARVHQRRQPDAGLPAGVDCGRPPGPVPEADHQADTPRRQRVQLTAVAEHAEPPDRPGRVLGHVVDESHRLEVGEVAEQVDEHLGVTVGTRAVDHDLHHRNVAPPPGRPTVGRWIRGIRRRPGCRSCGRARQYEAAFRGDPLVTVRIGTYQGARVLCERALASVRRQTYAHWEAVVVGDGCTDDTAERVADLADPRITFHNRPVNGPYPQDTRRRWQVAGSHAFNEAADRARGRWIAPLDQDDEWDDDHLLVLLRTAQQTRAELVYGRMTGHPRGLRGHHLVR